MDRVFLGWDQPTLAAAVGYLERDRSSRQWDLTETIVIVPGRRAGRRLLERLAHRAEELGVLLRPPTIATEGTFPELIYTPKFPFASTLVQELVWLHTIRFAKAEEQKKFIARIPPNDEFLEWLDLARLIRSCHIELAADRLRFKDLLRRREIMDVPSEAERWRTLAGWQTKYLHALDKLRMWDIQTARLVAIENREFQTTKRVVVLACVDLNRVMRTMLEAISPRVTILIAAPSTHSDRFDGCGCVLPGKWIEAPIKIEDEQLRHVEGPSEQADEVADWLFRVSAQHAADEVTVGLCDESLAPRLQRRLEPQGVNLRFAPGKTFGQSRVATFLDALAEYLENPTLSEFGAFMRHPDAAQWTMARLSQASVSESTSEEVGATEPTAPGGGLIEEIDLLASEHYLVASNAEYWPAAAKRKVESGKDFVAASLAERAWSERLSSWRQSRTIGNWSGILSQLLREVYDSPADTQSDEELADVQAALSILAKQLEKLLEIPVDVDYPVTAAEVIRLVLGAAESEIVPSPIQQDSVEAMGWLELPLDDAPCLAITTVNEGFLPQRTSASPLLPDSLRQKLGLADNARRHARDAYYLSAMLNTRKEVVLISADQDGRRDVMLPSRLVFATEPMTKATRLIRMLDRESQPISRTMTLATDLPVPPRTTLSVPQPNTNLEWRSIRVTQFADYLRCPYRFYLRHVLGLSTADDSGEELNPLHFGQLVHRCLEELGRSQEQRQSTSREELAAFLSECLRVFSTDWFGERRPAGIEIQLEHLKSRLGAFAEWQANWASSGWEIWKTEEDSKNLAMDWIVDGHPIQIQGRIDRIDRHRESGMFAIFDYKTSETARSPEETHGVRSSRNGEPTWSDLQLPLYRRLAERLGMAPVQGGGPLLGYIVLPRNLGDIGARIAEWDQATLQTADEAAQDVIRNIRNGVFWPPNDRIANQPADQDEFAAICQTRRVSARANGFELAEA